MTKYVFFEMGLLVFTAFLGAFCLMLSHRLRKLNDLEAGLGGAIAVLALEIDRLDKAIHTAISEADRAAIDLERKISLAKEERRIWDLQKQILPKEHWEVQSNSLRRSRRKKGGINA